MGLARFFGMMSKTPPKDVQEESVHFDEIGTWILKKAEENNTLQQEILEEIRERSLILSRDLDEKIMILADVNLANRKVDERTKRIVSHNVRTYVMTVQRFKDALCALNADSIDKIADEIRGLIYTLEKSSHASYKKVAYLIGDELVNIREAIRNFYLGITTICDENSEMINSATVFLSLQTQYSQLEEKKNTLRDVEEKIDTAQNEIILHTKEKKKRRKDIDIITQSESYAANIERKKIVITQEAEVAAAMRQLQLMVDFKSLGNVFHVSEKQMRLVQEHKNRFVTTIEQDGGNSLMKLLDEAKLNTEEIRSTLRNINDKRKRIITNTSAQESDQIEKLLSEIEVHNAKIDVLKNQTEKDKNQYGRLNAEREKIVNTVRKDLATLHVTVEEGSI